MQGRDFERETYSVMKFSALSGLVSFASEITRRPASPPSSLPSSTSTSTPARRARSTCGLASAIFSSSVYRYDVKLSGQAMWLK